jgi:hypothetical protein
MSTGSISDARLRDATIAIRYLELHPVEYETILTLARLETEPATLDFVGHTAVDEASVEARRRHAERYIATGIFRPCGECYCPVIYFGDGRALTWPELKVHECPAAAGVREIERMLAHAGRSVGPKPRQVQQQRTHVTQGL